MRKRNLASLALLAQLFGACGGDEVPLAGPAPTVTNGADAMAGGNTGVDSGATTGTPASRTGLGLQWKRYAAFEADLARALELSPDALCHELGGEACIRGAHLVALGGHEPFETGMFEPSEEPLATTPTVVERIVLNACINRVTLDVGAGGGAAVFKAFSLEGVAPTASDATTKALVTELFRRLLSRDPMQTEVDAIAALAGDGVSTAVSAVDFATLACFAIGTSAEFLFF